MIVSDGVPPIRSFTWRAFVVISRCVCRHNKMMITYIAAVVLKGVCVRVRAMSWTKNCAIYGSQMNALSINPNRVLAPLKSASKTRSGWLVRPSEIFVWWAIKLRRFCSPCRTYHPALISTDTYRQLSSCVDAVIVLWFRHAHRHARSLTRQACHALYLISSQFSTDTLDAIIMLWFRKTHIMLLSSIDTSAMIRHADIILLWFRLTHHHAVIIFDILWVYPSQTKILEGCTSLSECFFEALFKGVSTRFGLWIVEKCFENAFGKIGSDFQNIGMHSLQVKLQQWINAAGMHVR